MHASLIALALTLLLWPHASTGEELEPLKEPLQLEYEYIDSPLVTLEMPIVDLGGYGKHRRDPRRITHLRAFRAELYIFHGDGYFDQGDESVTIYRYNPTDGKIYTDIEVPEAILSHSRVIDNVLYVPGVEFSQNSNVPPGPSNSCFIYYKDDSGWHWTGGVKDAWHLFDVYKSGNKLWCTTSFGKREDDPVRFFGRIFSSSDHGKTWELFPEGDEFRLYYFFSLAKKLYVTGAGVHKTYLIEEDKLKVGPDLAPDVPQRIAGDLPWEAPGTTKKETYRTVVADIIELGNKIIYRDNLIGYLYIFDGKTVKIIEQFSPKNGRRVKRLCYDEEQREIYLICEDDAVAGYTLWRTKDMVHWQSLGVYASREPQVTALAVLDARVYIGDATGHLYRSKPISPLSKITQ